MERLTKRSEDTNSTMLWFVDKEKWGMRYEPCEMDSHQVREVLCKLAEYEDAEEDGLLPRFHLGDEFWCLYIDKVVKAKIVSLQQKKDGSWNYTLSREISENYHDIAYYKECEYGKYFCSTKAEAEQALAKMKGEEE